MERRFELRVEEVLEDAVLDPRIGKGHRPLGRLGSLPQTISRDWPVRNPFR